MSPHLLSGAARLAGSSLLRLQSDERLVALVRDGHDPAFAAVDERYRPELLRYCTRLVGEARAEDVLQQAFLNAHMALRANDNAIQLRPWLYKIAHNAGLNVLRSSRGQAELDDQLAAPGSVEQEFESRERLRDALAAIARLPEPQRDALTLRAVEGRSHTEIATALGVTPGAARQHLHRARTSLRTAVSAVTPYGLIARLAMAGTDGGAPIAATAGAGIGATAVKVGAGLLAAGAVGIGATKLPVLHVSHPHRAAPAAHAVAAAPALDAAVAGHGSARLVGASPTAVHEGRGHGLHAGAGRHGGGGGESHHAGSSDGGQGHREGGSSGSGDSGHSGSSGGDGHSGSGSGSHDGGGDGGGRDGSSTTGSHDGSGSSGSDGSGSGDSGSTSSGSGDSGSTSSGSGDSGSTSSGSGDGGSDGSQTVTTTVQSGDSSSGGGDLSSGSDGGGSGGGDAGSHDSSGD